ncbi:helix-turn-helix domain-containing protein [uncultured Veillonella sp.]|uniref:helix-turn-helix domain-containing protein n=1 Tax=uncultured Veillonella sp. TaxID=159268 RepID=UPI0025EEB174|nr:helix-turn-helix domain-containing protein [uncultured Veillonella sp.]
MHKHLNFEERFYLKERIALGDSITVISRVVDCSRTTIYTKLKYGTVIQIRQGKSQLVYLADSGQAIYERQRVGSFNTIRVGAIESYINCIKSKVLNNH